MSKSSMKSNDESNQKMVHVRRSEDDVFFQVVRGIDKRTNIRFGRSRRHGQASTLRYKLIIKV